MAKNNRGGVKNAQVNTAVDSAVEMAAAITKQTHSSMDRNHQVDTIRMLHETFRMDPNAAEHTGFDASTIEKINHFSALGMVTIAALESMYGTSDFAITLRRSNLSGIKEAAAELNIQLGDAKLLENKTDDGEEVVEIESKNIQVPDEVKTKLEEDKKAIDATKGKIYDPTKIKDDSEFKEALAGLLSVTSDGKLIDNIYKAIAFYLAYKKVVAHRVINENTEILKNTKDKEYKKKIQGIIDAANADLKNLNSMSNTDVFREIVKITGHVGLLTYGFANHLFLVTAQTGSPISAWCELYASSIDRKTGESKYSYSDIADIVKCLVEFGATNIINKATAAIEEENKLPENERVQDHIDTANKNIAYANKAMDAIKCAPSSFVVSLKDNYLNKDNKAHKTVVSIKKVFYKDVPAEKMLTVKLDSLLNCCTQYAGIISNLFRDPLNTLSEYSLDKTDNLEFKTPEELHEEREAAEKAALESAAKKAKENAAKKEAALKTKEKEAKKAVKEEKKEQVKKLFDQLKVRAHGLLIELLVYLIFNIPIVRHKNTSSMKNLVTTMLGLAFLIVGCNIANIMGYSPPSNLQTVAASTVQQPIDHLFGQVKNTNPEIVHDTIRVQDSCTHKQQPVKTVVKTVVKSKKDTLYVPLLFIATPVEGDSVDYAYNVHHVSK